MENAHARTVFLPIIQFLVHVGPTVVALQDRRPAVETRSEVFSLSHVQEETW